MPRVRFEPTIPAFEWAEKVHALGHCDRPVVLVTDKIRVRYSLRFLVINCTLKSLMKIEHFRVGGQNDSLLFVLKGMLFVSFVVKGSLFKRIQIGLNLLFGSKSKLIEQIWFISMYKLPFYTNISLNFIDFLKISLSQELVQDIGYRFV
jgi:hypothetical protein